MFKKRKIIINKTRNICRTVNSSVKIAKICHTDFVDGYFVNILLVSVRHCYKLIPKFLWLVFDKNGAKNFVLRSFCEHRTSARCVAIQCAPSSRNILQLLLPLSRPVNLKKPACVEGAKRERRRGIKKRESRVGNTREGLKISHCTLTTGAYARNSVFFPSGACHACSLTKTVPRLML